ncbi:MAG TPA: hypothetical protein VEQ18_01310 [Candidatus Nitrosocosmicus sp.]|nr:hypothetical protein [Candidatus Nitrosocosmicus sp.]
MSINTMYTMMFRKQKEMLDFSHGSMLKLKYKGLFYWIEVPTGRTMPYYLFYMTVEETEFEKKENLKFLGILEVYAL